MSDTVSWILDLDVNSGRGADFKVLMAEMVHLGNFGEKYAARFMDILTSARCVVYGSPSDEVRGALAGLGPVYMEAAAGFAR